MTPSHFQIDISKKISEKFPPRGVRPPKFFEKWTYHPDGNVPANFHPHISTRSPAVAGMADSWPHINLIDFHFRDLEMTP